MVDWSQIFFLNVPIYNFKIDSIDPNIPCIAVEYYIKNFEGTSKFFFKKSMFWMKKNKDRVKTCKSGNKVLKQDHKRFLWTYYRNDGQAHPGKAWWWANG